MGGVAPDVAHPAVISDSSQICYLTSGTSGTRYDTQAVIYRDIGDLCSRELSEQILRNIDHILDRKQSPRRVCNPISGQ